MAAGADHCAAAVTPPMWTRKGDAHGSLHGSTSGAAAAPLGSWRMRCGSTVCRNRSRHWEPGG
jgi:hypothetical protein